MKRIVAILLVSVAIASSLWAEEAFWVGNAPYGASWTNEDHFAFTDLYTQGSTLVVTHGDTSINVTVEDALPPTLENRDFGLTEQVLKELGIWGEGDTTVSVRLRSGSVQEENKGNDENSGWFTLSLGTMEGKEAVQAYKTLVKKGFKPQIKQEGDLVALSVKYIVEYEKDETIAKLESLGYPVQAEEPSENPYL